MSVELFVAFFVGVSVPVVSYFMYNMAKSQKALHSQANMSNILSLLNLYGTVASAVVNFVDHRNTDDHLRHQFSLQQRNQQRNHQQLMDALPPSHKAQQPVGGFNIDQILRRNNQDDEKSQFVKVDE
jgi:flagellar basal body-associated protein FliL